MPSGISREARKLHIGFTPSRDCAADPSLDRPKRETPPIDHVVSNMSDN
jgi:hypothetical protein